MHALPWLLRRAHCRTTQHLFAVDALPLVQTPAGKRLTRLLLKYHRRYLTGATDPDTRIRDFQNQIIHVEDGYWGGGPRVAQQWYHRLLLNLERRKYADAALAAGILCHYFTDALQPLHTGETKREAIVHLPMERSFYHSYDAIRQLWIDNPLRSVYHLSDEPDWLRSAMLWGARSAHDRFSLLVNSYRFRSGIVDPPAGLNEISRSALAELLGLAVTGWARIIERAAQDAENRMRRSLPSCTTTVSLMVATIQSPFRIWHRHCQSQRLDRSIDALAKEYAKRGYLYKHLPDEVDIKQRVNQVRRDEKIYQIALAERARVRQIEQAQSQSASAKRVDAVVALAANKTAEFDLRMLTPFARAASAITEIDAKLFSAAGYQTIEQMTRDGADLVHAELHRLALTQAGQDILQGGPPPSLAKVQRLIETAGSQRAA